MKKATKKNRKYLSKGGFNSWYQVMQMFRNRLMTHKKLYGKGFKFRFNSRVHMVDYFSVRRILALC